MKLRLALIVTLAWVFAASCGGGSSQQNCPNGSQGTEGCACMANSSCRMTASGSLLVCTSGTCTLPACPAGNPKATGCECGASGECAGGALCLNGRCEKDTGQTLTPPADPQCMTPCKGGSLTQPDGTTVTCNHEGLLAGCVGDAVCDRGTCISVRAATDVTCVADVDCGGGASCSGGKCLSACRTNAECATTQHCANGLCVAGAPPAAEAPGACSTDGQCPSFQTCIANRCYSDCEQDSDCRDGRTCFSHVCRVACTTAGGTCPTGTSCSQVDATRSFCMPLDLTSPPRSAVSAPLPANETGYFEVSTHDLSPTAQSDQVSFQITSHFNQTKTFTVRKFKHTEIVDGKETVNDTQPMSWMSLAAHSTSMDVAESTNAQLTIDVAAGGTATITLAHLTNAALPRWDGAVAVSAPNQNDQFVDLTVSRSPQGQWVGSAFYLANFGTSGLEAWMKNRDDDAQLSLVGNALVRRWGALRSKRISLQEFEAALTATLSGSWRWPSVQASCPEPGQPNPNVGCYLYDNKNGYSIFSNFLPSNPVPTGVVEFPVTLNMHAKDPAQPAVWSGRVVSSDALQFAGDPTVDMRFAGDPGVCKAASGEPCLTMLDQLTFTATVGARYPTTATDTACAAAPSGPGTFVQRSVPWLVPGFAGGTIADAQGNRARYECRDLLRPFGTRSGMTSSNLALAASNPIPDGVPREREISLIDGAIVNTDTMIVLFRERFPSFLDAADTEGFSSYGVMELHRKNDVLQPADYVGSSVSTASAAPAKPLNPPPACSAAVLAPFGGSVTDANWYKVAEGLISGLTSDVAPVPVSAPEEVHYLCKDTDLFDSGPTPDSPSACPAGSEVIFFTLSDGLDLTQQECQRPTSCSGAHCSCTGVLQSWIESKSHQVRVAPYSRCTDDVHCDANRYDLRDGRMFYQSSPTQTWDPLDLAVDQAFRYKTKYRNHTTGTNVGFAPQPCIPNSTQSPYCYDAPAIEAIQERIDCVISLYVKYHGATNAANATEIANAKTDLHSFLVRNFSYTTSPPTVTPELTYDGFERLNAELLIMLGDEAFTKAFASRFDLAGLNLGDFPGDKFEPNGLALKGAAGYEFVELYRAAQYYRMTLERFYKLSNTFWTSLKVLTPQEAFITTKTVVSYFARLIKASANETRVWSEISKRYQAFGRADLARLVVQRSYTSAHLESIALSRMMLQVLDVASSNEAAQIKTEVENAQDIYTAALMDMRTVYKNITDQVTSFGFQPDYIPFPVLYDTDNNAFEKVQARAQQLLADAKEKETLALEDNRSFETSSASFQSELSGIANEYDNQLAALCGSFTVNENGHQAVYPATPQYAYLSPATAKLGDPCGMVGNGQLTDSITNLNLATLNVEALTLAQANLNAEISDASARAKAQCQRLADFQTVTLKLKSQEVSLQKSVNVASAAVSQLQREKANVNSVLELTKCAVGTSTDCPTGMANMAIFMTASVAIENVSIFLDSQISDMQGEIADLQEAQLAEQLGQECAALQIDLVFTLRDLNRKLLELAIEATKATQQVRLARSDMQKLRNQAVMLMKQQTEANDMAIDVEASRSDPNVRIYRNDTVVAADRTFNLAVREAYRLTKIFEYYTSQSYPDLDKLKLVRMVSHGDYSLESYVTDLVGAFQEFQEQYGAPSVRVAVISVKDDIFGAPNLGNNSTAVAQNTRKQTFVEWLTDAARLDNRGYIVIPFTTTLDELSPLTRNHKIKSVQVDISGGNIGDPLGRVYLAEKGTSLVKSLGGQSLYYALPERTAVINTKFNGTQTFTADVYTNTLLRDRPLVNTEWQLILNTKDEAVNKDIDLTSLTDIKLIIYYTDFVAL